MPFCNSCGCAINNSNDRFCVSCASKKQCVSCLVSFSKEQLNCDAFCAKCFVARQNSRDKTRAAVELHKSKYNEVLSVVPGGTRYHYGEGAENYGATLTWTDYK